MSELQEAIDTIEEFAPENRKCEVCINPATEWHKFKPYCYPHFLARTANGELFNKVTQHLS
jgi:hypothetical protein